LGFLGCLSRNILLRAQRPRYFGCGSAALYY
jgi:hypothetical protein